MDEPRDIDTRLMLAFRAGDVAAFEELVRRNARRMAALAARYLGDASEAEDVVQEAFIRVHRARRRYRPTARFTTWLHRIVVNLALNRRRSRRVPPISSLGPGARLVREPPDDGPGPAARIEAEDRRLEIEAALAELPAKQRMAILLNLWKGLRYEEVARAMGLRTGAVKSLLFRARENLRGRLVR